MKKLEPEFRESYISTYNESKNFKFFPHAFWDMIVRNEDIIRKRGAI